MADNAEQMAIVSDEGGIFDILAGRYSNGVPNLDLFLQSHAGSPVRVDRGSRPAVVMENPALTMVLSVQPDLLNGLASKPGFRGRGLLARFLYMLPVSTLGRRQGDTAPVPDDVARDYNSGIEALLELPTEKEPRRLELSPDAYSEWFAFFQSVEREPPAGGRFEHICDWADKLTGLCSSNRWASSLCRARIQGSRRCETEPGHDEECA
jgi:hypothetical protein